MKQEPEEVLNSEVEAESSEDIDTLKQALAEERKKAEEYLASWQRAQADFINYKRRTEQERGEFNKYANATLLQSLLPVLNDLERALNSIPLKLTKLPWVDGVRLIANQLKTTLEAQGLTPIKALGEPFDPNFHEAVRQDKGKEGIVVEELRKGYMLYDKLLSPTVVVVGNGEEEEREDK